MDREEAIELAIDEHDCKYSEELMNRIYHDFEEQLKAKDEKIEVLNISSIGLHDLYIDYKKLSRSIVAMLFWEWRKHKRMYGLSKFGSYLAVTHLNNATLSKLIFQQAYKMLKDNQ